ncbi:MAG: hypothetical protein SGBAC_011766 [Bacillariaceae sp.]
MKLSLNKLTLVALAAFALQIEAAPPAHSNAGGGGAASEEETDTESEETGNGNSIGLCADQLKCISFTKPEVDSASCALTGDCGVKVCMIVDTTIDGCGKEGAISHLCSASSGGCAAYDNDGTTPLTGKGSSGDCTSTIFDGKCEPESYGNQERIEMCQTAEPGETLYWALKDSTTTDTGPYDYTNSFTFDQDGTTCAPTISCEGGHLEELQCADPQNGMFDSTRVWKYAIPDGGDCDVCADPTSGPTSGPTSAPTSGPTSGPTPVPTSGPTSGPTSVPTSGPTSEPTSGPTAPVAVPTPDLEPSPSPPVVAPTNEAGSNGDPHFKTWRNEHFEYHGQCDLVLASDPNFADGLGLDVQIRTKLVRHWSYIKSAAIRIGSDLFEIEGKADDSEDLRYWKNLEFRGAVTTVGGFPVIFKSHTRSDKKQSILIDLTSKYPGSMIELQTWREFVKVNFQNPTAEAFGKTVGMLGDFQTGNTIGRDGATLFDDYTLFGNEWQVLPADNMLFHNTEHPQFPSKCIEPEDPRGDHRRRLDESSVSTEDAEKACSSLTDELDRKDCVYDILATQDLGMAGAY